MPSGYGIAPLMFQNFINGIIMFSIFEKCINTFKISLFDKLSTCEFHNSSLQFLNEKKFLDWPKPTSFKNLQGFLASDTSFFMVLSNSAIFFESINKHSSNFKLLIKLLKQNSYLLILLEPFKILTYQNALKYFILSEFNFTIAYQPSIFSVVPDSLSHWENVHPRGGKSLPKIVLIIFCFFSHLNYSH
ncbi:hypothetical protein VP01_3608g4 [Puccinia sorghi]|uniref:Uncharacterized protein n=1 Tax=Puccinia sorghi TaxID=27349 RepID=A0A0L6UV43_9BASI|nr:hypothetical protein VP01_3608g4 [Puccinia sorghi]